MKIRNKKDLEEWRRDQSRSKIRHKCKCGHTVYIPEYKEKVVCDNCWETVYKNEKDEFKDKLKRQIIKAEQRELLKR